MRIDHLELKNFKNFGELKVDFAKGVNLFVGTNGSGKTSLLESICVAVGAFFGTFSRELRLIDNSEISIVKGKKMPVTQVAAHSNNLQIKGYTNAKSWVVKRSIEINTLDSRNFDERLFEPISIYGKQIFDTFENSDDKTLAPLIVYFSTQRLFNNVKTISSTNPQETSQYLNIFEQPSSQKYDVTLGRRNGYKDCLREGGIKSLLLDWFKNAVTRRATLQIKEIDRTDIVLENVEEGIRKTLIEFLDLPEDFSLKIYQEPDFDFELFLQYDNAHDLPLTYYSDGFRNLLFLVIEMIWRASQLNPWLALNELSKQIKGIAIIDEIDLHLHPKWQAKAISWLQSLFPNVQFFITTHSPTVIANFSTGSLYTIDNNAVTCLNEKHFGKEVNFVLRNILGASDRHIQTQEKLDTLFKLIDNGTSMDRLQPLLNELTDMLGNNDPDIQKALSSIEWNNFKKEDPHAVHR